jgi:hypothetical protein
MCDSMAVKLHNVDTVPVLLLLIAPYDHFSTDVYGKPGAAELVLDMQSAQSLTK